MKTIRFERDGAIGNIVLAGDYLEFAARCGLLLRDHFIGRFERLKPIGGADIFSEFDGLLEDRIAYHRIERPVEGDPEIGWALDPLWWGRGLATEAGGACVAWAFGELGYERVVSITIEENTASRNVMAKLGFTLHARVPSEWGELWVHAVDR